MTTFNNVLNEAKDCVCSWGKKEVLFAVTIVRDVYGKLSFLMDNKESITESDKDNFTAQMAERIGSYFSGRIYWKRLSHSQKSTAEREKFIIQMIEAERESWDERDEIVFYLSERAIAKKAWIYQREVQESVWPYEEAVSEDGCKVISFYSFKGGMGRTTALASVALTLVHQGRNVIMVDMDIEAPGLASLFFDEEVITGGLLDYLLEHEIDSEMSIDHYLLDVTEPALLDENSGHLYLMPAGKVDDNYLQKLARIDYQDHREGYLRNALATMLIEIKNTFSVDYLLLDARAGFHDMGGIAVTQLPHGVVLFGNDSRQSWDGITQVLRSIAKGHDEDFPLMIVGTMCPNPALPAFAAAKEHFIRKSYSICLENYYNINHELPGIDAEGELHYPELISYTESLMQGIELYSDGSQEQNQRVNTYKTILTGESYRKITARIQGWFGEN